MKKVFCLSISFLLLRTVIHSQNFITEKNEAGSVPIVTSSQATSIYVDPTDDWLVHKAASLLQNDIEMVTGKKPGIVTSLPASAKNIIIIGTINGSSTIDDLIKAKKLTVEKIRDEWEAFTLQT